LPYNGTPPEPQSLSNVFTVQRGKDYFIQTYTTYIAVSPSPTPTQTPTQTPSETPTPTISVTPTPTSTPCPCDYYGIDNNGGTDKTIQIRDCRGILRNIIAPSGITTNTCACEVIDPFDPDIFIYYISACVPETPSPTPTQTPSNTPTPTQTPSNTPTPTPTRSEPRYTLTVYANTEGIPNSPYPIGGSNPVETAFRVYYSTALPVLTQLGGNVTATACNLLGTISNLRIGDVVYLGVRAWSTNRPMVFATGYEVPEGCYVDDESSNFFGTALDTGNSIIPPYISGGGISITVTGNMALSITGRIIEDIKIPGTKYFWY
jgi:hypothetical protein